MTIPQLLDSNILIYATLPEHNSLRALISAPAARVSAISIPEVFGFTGLLPAERYELETWFSEIETVPVTEDLLWDAAALRRERKMSLGDSIIAATALANSFALVTRNQKDFSHLSGLKIINPFAE